MASEPKTTNHPDQQTTQQKPPASAVDNRLEPLEEFRSRAEGWMKEVTAQVARLAGSFEQADKRREALENRLSDIEERIRSLLTLTELVSMDKNPFASRPTQSGGPNPANPVNAKPPGTSTSPAPAPAEAFVPDAPAQSPPSDMLSPPSGASNGNTGPETTPRETTGQPPALQEAPTTPEADAQSTPQHEAPPAPETDAHTTLPFPAAGRPGVEVIPIENEALHQNDCGNSPPDQEDDHDARTDAPASKDSTAPAPDGAPGVPSTKTGYHPNDPRSETVTAQSKYSSTHGQETTGPGPASENGSPSHDTPHRMLVIAWADLLATADHAVDLESFTGFYVDAEWVGAETARLVRQLAQTMAPHKDETRKVDLRRLHEATVQLLAEHDPSLATFTRADDPTHEEANGGAQTTETENPEPIGGALNAT